MAAYAAHLTRTAGGAPSVFQLAAADALSDTLKPALRRLTEYLCSLYPDKCGWCVDWYDELYLLFDLCLQYHYLKHYAASFSESFYGLVRVGVGSPEFGLARLPAAAERASLLALAAAPYLRDKAEAYVERWRDSDAASGKDPRARLTRAAIRVYSTAHLAWSLTRLAQYARFLSGAARAHAPPLAALGLALAYAPPPITEMDDPTWTDAAKALLSGDFGGALPTARMAGGAMLRAAQYGAFAVQLLRWWDRAAPRSQALPPPPPPEAVVKEGATAGRYRNRCPVCLQRWKTPTVLPVSGYVFCYSCVSREVRTRGRCPASGLPATETDLVRLYLDE